MDHLNRISPTGAIEYELRSVEEEYTRFRGDRDLEVDIMLIDGPWRLKCFANHLHILKSDGLLYLDNSNVDSSTGQPGEVVEARARILDFAYRTGRCPQIFTDFAPGALHATQGLLVSAVYDH